MAPITAAFINSKQFPPPHTDIQATPTLIDEILIYMARMVCAALSLSISETCALRSIQTDTRHRQTSTNLALHNVVVSATPSTCGRVSTPVQVSCSPTQEGQNHQRAGPVSLRPHTQNASYR